MKNVYSSLYPSIILENNIAPNTQLGRIIIEDPNDPDKPFSLNEHPDMFSNDDDEAKYSRGGEFLENMMSGNVLEFCRRWMMLGDLHQVLEDLIEYYRFNKYRGVSIDADMKDAVYFSKNNMIEAVSFREDYSQRSAVTFDMSLNSETKKELIKDIEKGAIL